MNNYYDTMSEQLTAYLDGELPVEMHEELFEELARNTRLREEMNEHLLIRSAVQKDNALPSSRVLDNLLAAVESGGETLIPLGHGGHIANTSLMHNATISSLRSVMGGLFALMFGIMTPSIVHESSVQTVFELSGSDVVLLQDAETNRLSSGGNSSHPSIQIPNGRANTFAKKSAVMSSFVHDEKRTDNAVGSEQNTMNDNTFQTITPLETAHNQFPSMSSLAMSQPRVDHVPAMSLQSSVLPTIPHDNIAVRYRGLGYNAALSAGQWFNNMGIGILYKLGNGHYIGVDINNERPSLSYEGIVDNRQFTYQQTPSYLSVSLAYRYNADMLKFGDFEPFAEVSGGLALPNMPVGRIGSGIQYSPSQTVSFSVGMEYNTLQYKFLGNNYTSNNWGITYGIMINMDTF